MDLKSATEAARLAWLCNTTTADPRWALRQLHGLADLLVDNRDKLISALALGKLFWPGSALSQNR